MQMIRNRFLSAAILTGASMLPGIDIPSIGNASSARVAEAPLSLQQMARDAMQTFRDSDGDTPLLVKTDLGKIVSESKGRPFGVLVWNPPGVENQIVQVYSASLNGHPVLGMNDGKGNWVAFVSTDARDTVDSIQASLEGKANRRDPTAASNIATVSL